MKNKNSGSRGFSLIEVLLVLGIGVILAGVAFFSLSGRRDVTELNSTAKEMATTLREAQLNAMAQKSGSAWGVRFDTSDPTNSNFSLFSGFLSNASVTVAYKALPQKVQYLDPSAVAGVKSIGFSQITGAPSEAGFKVVIYLNGDPSASSTIKVLDTGAIAYDILTCPASTGCYSTTVIIENQNQGGGNNCPPGQVCNLQPGGGRRR